MSVIPTLSPRKKEAGKNTEGQKTNSNVRTISFLTHSGRVTVLWLTQKDRRAGHGSTLGAASSAWSASPLTGTRTPRRQAGPTHQCYLSIPFKKHTSLLKFQMCPFYGLHTETSTSLFCTIFFFKKDLDII